ncbi:MAG: CHC2 zinc finger domain-containing protein, partial [Candidatus Woesearchaeota archaeon]
MKNNLIPQHFIDKLLKETDILSIIEEDIDGELKLDSNGEYVGYHKNKHGSSSKTSLRVNLNKFDYGVYHCFNCGEGGNVIKWLMLNRNMLFPEAVKYLAIKNKIEMPELDPEEQKKYEQYMQERIEIENIYNITARKYNEQLEEKHYAQLEKQWGIKRKTADDLQIGFAPAKDNFLYIELLELGCSVKILNKSGLFIKGHDFFQGRIVFPYWKEGNVVSFIARKTDQTPDNKYEQAKYKKLLTYSEKRPFVSKTVKNEYLYGIDTIKGQDYFIITEGITDAIMAHQSGLPCISPVTVKFRKDDKKKLEKIASRVKRIFIANDNEVNNTGSKGALASAKYLFKKGHQYVYIINIPKPDNMDKIDLAEYLKSHTKEDFEELMAKSKDPLTIGIKKVKDAPKDKKIEVAKDIYPLFKNLKPMVKETYFNDLHKAFKTLKIGKKVLRNAIQEAIEEENKKDKSYQENFKIGQDIIKSKTTGPISSLLEDEKGYYYINECYETDDIKPEYISNFKITVEEILIHPEEEVLSGYLTYNDGKKNEIIMTSEALVSNINFKKNIPSKAVWLGSEKDLQKLKINIYSKKPIKRKAVT